MSKDEMVEKCFDMLLNNRYMDVATSKEGFSIVLGNYSLVLQGFFIG